MFSRDFAIILVNTMIVRPVFLRLAGKEKTEKKEKADSDRLIPETTKRRPLLGMGRDRDLGVNQKNSELRGQICKS